MDFGGSFMQYRVGVGLGLRLAVLALVGLG